MNPSSEEQFEQPLGGPSQNRTAAALDAARRELARRARQLERSEARFRDVIERNADGIVVLDQAGVIRFANPMAAALFDRSRESLTGTAFGFPVVEGETTELDLVRSGSPKTVEMRVVASDWDGQPAYIATLRDVTQQRAAEQNARRLVAEQAARSAAERSVEQLKALATENERLYREAQRANEIKSRFLAVVSHDLRTPLNAIIGYAALLGSGIPDQLSAASHAHVDRIQTSAQHLLYLLNELLAFARLEAGGEEVRPRIVDLRDVVREAAAVAEPLAAERGLELRLELPDQPVTTRTDPDKLRQALINLMGNGIKYTTDGGLSVAMDDEHDAIRIRVRDTGVGIERAHLGRIFEPFYQVAEAPRTPASGAGLGLSVVRRVMEMLGGDVAVQSVPGDGSEFTLTLPKTA